jgi:hypothetical protein
MFAVFLPSSSAFPDGVRVATTRATVKISLASVHRIDLASQNVRPLLLLRSIA